MARDKALLSKLKSFLDWVASIICSWASMLASLARSVDFCASQRLELLVGGLDDLPLGLEDVSLLLQQIGRVAEMIQAVGQLGLGTALACR